MPAVALFSFFHLPALSPLAPGTLEGGLPKGPGASTYLPLKKAKAALGGRKEVGHSPRSAAQVSSVPCWRGR